MEQFWKTFVPLFVAFDGIGLLPFFWALAHHLNPVQRKQVVTEAVVTAFLVSIGFLVVSRWAFALMGLQLSDVMIAGGAILIVLCLRDLLLPEKHPQASETSPGVVPLGVPLLAGPAVLTTVLLVRDQHGWWLTVAALIVNMAVVIAILRTAEQLMRWVGEDGARVISKIFSLVLTAYGIMLIRRGISQLLPPGHIP